MPIAGYEIHLGRTDGPDRARPLIEIADRMDGAVSRDGKVAGTYVHGIFAGDDFRRAFLVALKAPASDFSYEMRVDATLDALAAHLEAHVDCDALLTVASAHLAGN
jgi:adenosylcobyric acid synthase